MAWRSFGLGLVNFLFFGTVGIVLVSVAGDAGGIIQAILTVPALLIFGVLTILLTFGLTGIVKDLGARLFADSPAWKQITWGCIVLTFASALPLIGWFVLLPCVVFVGIGGTILGFFQKGA
jgi:hypothetical protein